MEPPCIEWALQAHLAVVLPLRGGLYLAVLLAMGCLRDALAVTVQSDGELRAAAMEEVATSSQPVWDPAPQASSRENECCKAKDACQQALASQAMQLEVAAQPAPPVVDRDSQGSGLHSCPAASRCLQF